jgi:protein-S-isoprenylcysteine O-methyltransferase Ste14
MNIGRIITIISLLWMGSEILLAVIKRSGKDTSLRKDKASLDILWIIIMLSIAAGIYVGMNGIGFISATGRWLPYIGISLIIAGLVLRWSAVLSLRRYFTVDVAIVKEHKIIDVGLYRFIRHPSYTGSLLSFLGLGISFSNYLTPIIIFLPTLFAFLYRMKIEEDALIEAFGDSYRSYMTKTRRLIPGIY